MNEENKSLSLSGYRTIDLILFTAIVFFLELINVNLLKNQFQGELYTISIMLPLTLIVMERWNYRAFLISAASGLAYCIANNGELMNYVIYIFGNQFILINLLWYKALGKKKLENSTGLKVCFAITGYVFVELGRAIMAMPFDNDFINNIKVFLVGDSLNVVIGIVILLIAGKQKGIFMDQIEYLKMLQAEREAETQRRKENQVPEIGDEL